MHGDREGLDCTDLEVSELVLRLLSGLLREHTLTMETAVLRHTSHTHSFLHLLTETQDRTEISFTLLLKDSLSGPRWRSRVTPQGHPQDVDVECDEDTLHMRLIHPSLRGQFWNVFDREASRIT